MNFFDTMRHLVDHGPFASDVERAAAHAAIDEHQDEHRALVTAVSRQQRADLAAAVPTSPSPGSATGPAAPEEGAGTPEATGFYGVPAGSDYHPGPSQ